MTVIGEAFVKILGQADQAQISRDVGTAVTAAGKAQQSRVRSLVGGVAKSAAGVIAGGVAIRKVTQFLEGSVEASLEAEASQVRLQNAFEKFPLLAAGNIESLKNLNEQLALKTRFDDDATAGAEAQLAQFKLTQTQIETLVPLVQDFAARTGRDLPAAASTLGKAILGQGRALKEVGVDFEDTGDRGANFLQLVDGLRESVGGFAEKEGKSAAGQTAILGNQFGELKETIGDALLPVIRTIVPPLTKLLTGFRNLPGPVKAVILGAAGLVTGLTALGFAVNTVRNGLSGLGINFGKTAVEAEAMTVAEGEATAATEALAVAEGEAAVAGAAMVSPLVAAGAVLAAGAVAAFAWNKALDAANQAAIEQHAALEASIPLLMAYTDNAIAGNHTRQDLVDMIKKQVDAAKAEGASVEEVNDILAAGEASLKRYDDATRHMVDGVKLNAQALKDLTKFAQNLDSTIDELNRNALRPGLLTPPKIPQPPGGGGGGGGGDGGGGGSSGGTTTTQQPTGKQPPDINVNIDGVTVLKTGQRRRVLLGGGSGI